MLMIATIKLEFNTKTYDYLIDKSEVNIKAGTILKDIYGSSSRGPLFKCLTVVDTKILKSIKDLPTHVTKILRVDKDFYVSRHEIVEQYIKAKLTEEENKASIQSLRTSIDIILPALKNSAFCFVTSANPEKEFSAEDYKSLKLHQEMVLDDIISIYKLGGNKITSGLLDFSIDNYLNSKDVNEREQAKTMILRLLLDAMDLEYEVVDWTKIM